MRHHHHRQGLFRPQLQHQALQALAGGRVQRGKRLIHQHQIRPQGQRARDGGALPLPAGNLPRELTGDAANAQPFQPGIHRQRRRVAARRMRSIGTVEVAHAQAQFHILPHGSPGQQAVILDDQAGLRARAGQRRAVDAHLTGLHQTQSGQEVEQRAFPAARGAQHGPGFAALDPPGKILKQRGSAGIGKRDLIQLNHANVVPQLFG